MLRAISAGAQRGARANSLVLRRNLAVLVAGDDSAFEAAKKKPKAVVYFTAVWCPPCKMISPIFEEMAKAKSSDENVFLKVDVDELPEITQDAGVSAMPTFQFFQNGKKVDQLKGADPTTLKELVDKYL